MTGHGDPAPTDPAIRPIRRLLVANRAEIARRIMRTARSMGIETVAVFSEPDAGAPHVADADLAVALGGSTAAESYLDVGKVLDAARRVRADAVHPGYGFLSESAELARAVLDAGLCWVGPPPPAIEQMGDKVAAKALAREAGVPTAPSASLDGDDPEAWHQAAATVGYPLLVKAAAGGGGRGMRRVDGEAELTDAVVTARREAASSFGDPTVFAERLVVDARHIEVQVMADRQGTVLHLGERECSIQRRHQKIVEEAPSPAVDGELRAGLGAAAVALATTVGYEGAGTVEFLLDDRTGEFWFLEMNTRLQVEHPVTEAVCGLDLVRLQLRVAEGRPLGLSPDDVVLDGHAIEVRLYAEEVGHEPSEAATDDGWRFTPTVGTIHRWDHDDDARWDEGVGTGTVVSPFYDGMLAKVIAWAPERDEAATRLARSLARARLFGPATNRDLLVAILDDPEFLAGRTSTTWLTGRPDLAAEPPPPADALLLAPVVVARARHQAADRHWPEVPRGWSNVAGRRVAAGLGHPTDSVSEPEAGLVHLHLEDRTLTARVIDASEHRCTLEVDGLRVSVDAQLHDGVWYAHDGTRQIRVDAPGRFPEAGLDRLHAGPVAPVPGRVVAVAVTVGQAVQAGDTLVVIEAMKVEHHISTPADGTVTAVLVAPGDNVDAHQPLVQLEEAP